MKEDADKEYTSYDVLLKIQREFEQEDNRQDKQLRSHKGRLTPKTLLQSAFGDKEETAGKEHINNEKLLDFPNELVIGILFKWMIIRKN